jgi:uncharacterized membrane protein (DUF2068 family)
MTRFGNGNGRCPRQNRVETPHDTTEECEIQIPGSDQMPDRSFKLSGIRTIAIFEAAKGAFVLVVGFGLLSLINHDAEAFAANLVRHLHLNPANKYPRIFVETARHVTNTQLWMFASLALFDATLRGIEAVGLWHDREWASWLGVVTAAIYLPIEVYELSIHVTWLKSATFLINIIIVMYLGYELYTRKQRQAVEQAPA